MMFSEKRASSRIKSMLAHAKVNAISRGLEEEKLVICEYLVCIALHCYPLIHFVLFFQS